MFPSGLVACDGSVVAWSRVFLRFAAWSVSLAGRICCRREVHRRDSAVSIVASTRQRVWSLPLVPPARCTQPNSGRETGRYVRGASASRRRWAGPREVWLLVGRGCCRGSQEVLVDFLG
jgi:hypothetical protein